MKMYNNLRLTGKYVYAVVMNDVGQAWKPASSAFVIYTTTRSDFVVQLPEIGSTGFYGPTVIPGIGPGRMWVIYIREGGSADHDADEDIGFGFESIDANVVQVIGNSTNATNLASVYGLVSSISDGVSTLLTNIGTILARLGAITGSGANTLKGYCQALARTDATLPTDLGGTFDPTTDSLQAHTDGAITLGLMSLNALKQFINVDSTLTTAVAGSVAKIAQGAATASVLLGEAITGATFPSGSWGERLQRIPNAPPGGAGGLPTVNASNYITGLASAVNITSTGGVINVGTGGAAGKVTVGTNSDKTDYRLSIDGVGDIGSSDAWSALVDSINNILNTVDADIYYAGLSFIKDSSQDEYTLQWYKNGLPLTSGITSPTIQVIQRSDGTNLIASTAMTQIGTTGAYKYDATTTARLATGDSALAIFTASIDSSTRTWRKVIGKDLPS